MIEAQLEGRTRLQRIGLFLGPLLCLLMLASDSPSGLSDAGWYTASIGVWMAVWWATEAIPIAVSALLPIVLFPLFDVASIQDIPKARQRPSDMPSEHLVRRHHALPSG